MRKTFCPLCVWGQLKDHPEKYRNYEFKNIIKCILCGYSEDLTKTSKILINPLKEEQDIYEENKADLESKWLGKFVLINKKTIKGPYESELEALFEAQDLYEEGKFLIRIVN